MVTVKQIFDAQDLSRIWTVAATSTNITGLTFKNGRSDYGGAIRFTNNIFNSNIICSFVHGTVMDNGGAVYSNDYVIIEDSIFVGNSAFEDGGAVLSYSANVKNSIFENNFAYAAEYSQCYGGAIKCADIEVYNSSFLNNHAGDYGGAIYAGSVLIRSSCFKNNYVEDNCGGAVYSNGFKNGIVDISDSIFSNNRALVDGVAIYSKLRVSLKNSTFINNAASGASVSQCCGGAISSKNNVKVDNSTFINNHADDYGGAIYADTVTWVEAVSYFVGNFAEDNQGGAIYTNKFNTDVISGIFIGNQAKDDDGGAIYINKENHLTFSRCTFKDNYAADEGGAIYVDSSSSVITLKYYNSFINNHAGDEGQAVFNKGKYGEIKSNWWGIVSPDFSEDLLVEWKAACFNEMHEDSNPLYKPYEDYFIKSSTIQNSGVQTGNPVKFNDAGAIYNIMQDIKGLSILNSNLMHGEYIINSLYNGFNVSDKLTMV